MKNSIKYILQTFLGYSSYLYIFSIFKIFTLKFDTKERDFFHFLSLIKPGKGDVLDLGANIGIMSYHLAKENSQIKIHAVEPVISNFKVLSKIKKRFNLTNVLLYQLALGTEVKKVEMVLPFDGKTKMQGLSHVIDDSITEWNQGDRFEVQMSTVDTLFNTYQIQGIKLDVENFEYFVLKGGESLIKKNRPIIYTELWENENREKCFSFLEELGYSAFVIEKGNMLAYKDAKMPHQNFIFSTKFDN
ncbi:MAG: FkbM family methyltransferase [Crocinitomicaceae bacterium]